MTQPDEAFQKAFDPQLTRRILRYIRPYLRLVALGLLMALLIAVANPTFGLLQRYAIDHTFGPQVLLPSLDLADRQRLIITYVVIMLTINWQLALISFAVLPVLYVVTGYFRARLRDSFRATRVQQAIVNTKLNENITGMLTVQLFGRENRNGVDFDRSNRRLLGANLRSVGWFALFQPSVSILGSVASGLVLWFAGRAILGEAGLVAAGITLGTLIAFNGWVSQLFQPIQDLADVFNNLQAAMAA